MAAPFAAFNLTTNRGRRDRHRRYKGDVGEAEMAQVEMEDGRTLSEYEAAGLQ
ncbi:MAG TPA: hypothetical protein VFN72_01000 [Solirubrobacterales bacterium]|nr:hypothetical protein [Solirubrobacterales bacterium]